MENFLTHMILNMKMRCSYFIINDCCGVISHATTNRVH